MPAPCFFCLVFGEKLALKSTTCYNRSMICLPQYLQGLPSRGQPFRLPQSTCTTAFLISFVSLVLTLLLTEPCSAESRSNYDAHQITASLNQSVQQHATHAMHRSYDSRYDAYHRLDEVTVSSPRVRWLPSLRFDLQIQVLVVIPNYDAQPNSAPETCRLLAQNEMSQYQAYFVPGAIDPEGTAVTHAECIATLKRVSRYGWFKKMISVLKARGCKIPTFSCKKCKLGASGKPPLAKFTPPDANGKTKIKICFEHPKIDHR